MLLVVGLGNPGADYAKNRHNIGFMALDRIAEDHGFAPWRGKFQGAITEGVLNGHKTLLLKPETFMNESGRAVREAAKFYKITPQDIVVFHDELDLAPRKIRVKDGGGHAGHNGLRSIDQHLGPDFRRVRLGIGHPGHKDRVTGYVLGNYAKTEIEPLSDLLGAVSAEAGWLADGDDTRFMNDVALRMGQ